MSGAIVSALFAVHAIAGPLEDGYGSDPTKPLGFAFERVTPTPDHDRKATMEVNLRVRRLRVPDSVLDRFYRSEADADWPYFEPRPALAGTTVGLEYVTRGKHSNGIVYLEYVDPDVQPGYWDLVSQGSDPLDGDFLALSKGSSLVAVGVNYAYEGHLVKTSKTGGVFGWSLLVGLGGGIAVYAGRLDRWRPQENGSPSYQRYLEGDRADDVAALPLVLPLADLNLATRFTFGERFVLRVEGGIHSSVSYGASLGVAF